MIQPDGIKKEAIRWYNDFLASSIQNTTFFPKDVRFGKIKPSTTLKDFQKIHREIEILRQNSKEINGHSYRIEFIKRKDQKIGEQLFPEHIYFETKDDYLKFIGKETEYNEFVKTSNKIALEIPELKLWLVDHPQKVIDNFGKWDDLLKVCRFFIENPKPNSYIRELPLEDRKSVV